MILKRTSPLTLALGLLVLAPTLPLQAQGADPYQALLKRDYGTANDELTAIEKQVQAATPDEKLAIETKLIAVLEAPDATMPGKQFALQMLRLVGSPKCVPAVGKQLADETLSHSARIVLQGLNTPAVDAALREAIGKTQGKVRLGLINTLGDRADGSSLSALTPLLTGDEATVNAALEAIAKIGTTKAADALDAAKVPDANKAIWAQAYLRCTGGVLAKGDSARAGKMAKSLLEGNNPSPVRAGAMQTIVALDKEKSVPLIVQTLASPDKWMKRAALAAVIAVPGKTATQAFAGQLAALTPDNKATLLGALSARGDREGLTPIVNKLAGDADATVKEAALGALGRLGDGSSVPVLVAALKEADYNALAVQSLTALRADGVAQSLIGQVEGGEAALRPTLLNVLAERRQTEALPVARKLAADADEKTRNAAINVVASLGTQADLQGFSEAILTRKTDAEREALARALSAIGNRLSDGNKRDDALLAAFGKADAATKVQLLPVMMSFAGNKNLQAARAALNEPGDVNKAAVRALAGWPDSSPLPDLRGVAKATTDNTIRILALRGWIGMVNKAPLKPEDKVQSFREALEVATRPEEKRQSFSEIARISHPEALKVVEPFLAEDAVKREALQAYVQIADGLTERQPAIAKEALQKALAATTDSGLRDRAQAALNKIK